jgi:uncharacterized membrane protein YedE/YeeE
MMQNWTNAAFGGALIGIAASMLLLLNGRIAGVSGILSNAVRGNDGLWRWAFLIGLIASPLWAPLLGLPYAIAHHQGGPLTIIAAGLLVGIGTQIGSGCTSGHGVCGISNLSLRSLVATIVFVATAMVTVFLVRHVVPVFVGGQA